MKSVAPKFAQRLAEDEIVMACDGLTMPEAIGALLEIVAQILADQDAVPETEDFERFMTMVAKSLSLRVAQLRWDALRLALHDATERPVLNEWEIPGLEHMAPNAA